MADIPLQRKEDYDATAHAWVKAAAKVFYDGDEEAAWQAVFETARENHARGWNDPQPSGNFKCTCT